MVLRLFSYDTGLRVKRLIKVNKGFISRLGLIPLSVSYSFQLKEFFSHQL